MDNAPAVPDVPMPPLVLARILDIAFDSPDFENVKEACRARHHSGPLKEPVFRDMAAHFASLLIGEPEPAIAVEAEADPALELLAS